MGKYGDLYTKSDGKIHHVSWVVRKTKFLWAMASMSQNVNVYRRVYDFLK